MTSSIVKIICYLLEKLYHFHIINTLGSSSILETPDKVHLGLDVTPGNSIPVRF